MTWESDRRLVTLVRPKHREWFTVSVTYSLVCVSCVLSLCCADGLRRSPAASPGVAARRRPASCPAGTQLAPTGCLGCTGGARGAGEHGGQGEPLPTPTFRAGPQAALVIPTQQVSLEFSVHPPDERLCGSHGLCKDERRRRPCSSVPEPADPSEPLDCGFLQGAGRGRRAPPEPRNNAAVVLRSRRPAVRRLRRLYVCCRQICFLSSRTFLFRIRRLLRRGL